MAQGEKQKIIPFLEYRYIAVTFSLILTVWCVYVWVSAGINKYGLDFLGGAEVVVQFNEPITPKEIRAAIDKAGYNDAVIQQFEDRAQDFSIRVKSLESLKDGQKIGSQVGNDIRTALAGKNITILKEEFVGPVIGEQIRKDGIIALVLALIAILIYVSVRFEFAFAAGGVVALFHDVTVAAGIYVFSGRELNSAALAAVLTIVGYSINDTIVIFDRVRENLALARRTPAGEKEVSTKAGVMRILNLSITQTLKRTILTSFATFLVVIILWQFGGGAVADLAFAFFIGLIVGCYSTVFIASPVVLALYRESKSQ